jgi:hypothetical protein
MRRLAGYLCHRASVRLHFLPSVHRSARRGATSDSETYLWAPREQTGVRRIRASIGATRKRQREEEKENKRLERERNRLRQAWREGYEARQEECTRRIAAHDGFVSLADAPERDRVAVPVPMRNEPLLLGVDAGSLAMGVVYFVAERQCYSANGVRVQWWTWRPER